jgi:hypothetical protein
LLIEHYFVIFTSNQINMQLLTKRILPLILFSSVLILASCRHYNSHKESITDAEVQLKGDTSALVVIWSSADKEIALKTALAYPLNSKLNGWIQNVTVLVWGPSVQLLAKDKEIQNVIIHMKQAGVTVYVDKKCVDEYQFSKEIEGLNLEVRSLGKPLTVFILQRRTILTF